MTKREFRICSFSVIHIIIGLTCTKLCMPMIFFKYVMKYIDYICTFLEAGKLLQGYEKAWDVIFDLFKKKKETKTKTL